MDRTIKLPEILALTKVSKMTIYRWIRNGDFPGGILVGNRSRLWLESEVEEWLEEKINQRDRQK